MRTVLQTIADFSCHTIIKTIRLVKSRIKEVKEDECSNSPTKIQVCAMFRAGDIQKNVSLRFMRLCMETPCLCPFEEGHTYGGRKLAKTYVKSALIIAVMNAIMKKHMSSILP